VPSLVLLFLLVSCLNFGLQLMAFVYLVRRESGSRAERLAGRGYVRTVLCRVIASMTYVAVAASQLSGAEKVGAEALLVFVGIQGMWLFNSALDVISRRRMEIRKTAGAP
jgi:hypothetical protein